MQFNIDTPEFWEEQYRNDNANWDIKSATPAFIELLKNTIVFGEVKGNILVAGSGKGYDAIEAAKQGFKVTAIDFSLSAVQLTNKLASHENVKVNLLNEDIFLLPQEYNNKFDFVYDYTTFCAFSPQRRRDYVKKLSDLLTQNGKVVIILFPVEKREGGPPFGIDNMETYKLFSEYFSLQYFSRNIKSIKPRRGRELLHVYKKAK
ncbi:MAG: hypothetical protein AUK34_08100 [Ignavibacteria bacterium CG2_30_36_16]|nr:MAG: hypothetical protein AUK34_08100 [Ignavibacteria bacterium CG2_30_36_16]